MKSVDDRNPSTSASIRGPSSSAGSLCPAPGTSTNRFGSAAASIQALAQRQRHDVVAITGDHQQRRGHRRDPLDRWIPVEQQPPHRQPWIVHRADVGQRRERRPQHQRRRWPLDRQADSHCGAEGFTEVRDTRRRSGCAASQASAARASAARPSSVGLPGVTAVAAVVEQQHRIPHPVQRGGEWSSHRAVSRRCR